MTAVTQVGRYGN